MKRTRNLIFDVMGVLFDHSTHQGKLFVPLQEGLMVLKECIISAEKQGHTLYICTNMQIPYMEILKEEYPEIMGAFKGIVTPSTALAKKPSPEIFYYLLDRFHLEPRDSVFIDDQETNIRAAQELGITGIHARDFFHVRSELERLGILCS
jgi:FMN phosphatase YigB (HAD superfamily)